MSRALKTLGIAVAIALCWTLASPDVSLAQRGRDDNSMGAERRDRDRDRERSPNSWGVERGGRHDRNHRQRRDGVTYDPNHGTYVDQFGRTVTRNGNRLDPFGRPIPNLSTPRDRRDDRRGGLYPDNYRAGVVISPRAGVVIATRSDLTVWPQTSLRFSYGAMGEYVRWRGGVRGAWGSSGIEGMFSYVDDNLRASLAVNPRLTRSDLEYAAVTVIRSYVDTNVTALAVQDGEFFVQYRTQTQGSTSSDKGEMFRTYVTVAGADSAYSATSQGGPVVAPIQ